MQETVTDDLAVANGTLNCYSKNLSTKELPRKPIILVVVLLATQVVLLLEMDYLQVVNMDCIQALLMVVHLEMVIPW